MEEQQACETPLEDLRNSALAEYELASNAIHSWNSFIVNAIKNYDPMEQSKNQTDRSDSEVRLEADVILRRIQELKMSDKEKELLSFCINNFDGKDSAERIIGFIDGKLEVLEHFIKLEIMIKRLAI